MFGSVHNGNVKLTEFFLGLFEESQSYLHMLGCRFLLDINDEKARFEIAEFLHSKDLFSCPKNQFGIIVDSDGNKNLVEWLVSNGYTGREKPFIFRSLA